MKVAITGHTKGIGLALANIFKHNGHEVVGFARTNGYDISKVESRTEIINQVADCDIFINNAHAHFSQCDMLFELWNSWQGQKKKIINLSTSYIQRHEISTRDIAYKTAKVALEDACFVLWNKAPWPAVMVVRPCITDTELVEHIEATNKVPPEHFAKIFYHTAIQTDFRVQVLGLAVNPPKDL
jgi:NAD(P)-dependent dehydrogenase (short-subunit alcohol dehydrogenase family)